MNIINKMADYPQVYKFKRICKVNSYLLKLNLPGFIDVDNEELLKTLCYLQSNLQYFDNVCYHYIY